MKTLLTITMLILTATVLNAQIAVNMSIEYQQNTDTILKDSVVPMLCIEFRNDTDSAQYFVLENYEQFSLFGFAAFGCPPTFEQWKRNLENFSYIKFNEQYNVRIFNNEMFVSDKEPQLTEDGEYVEDNAVESFFYASHNYLRKHKQKHLNNAPKIILLEPKESYFQTYDLTYFAVVCGEYEFIFEMEPPDETFPPTISKYRKCGEFVGCKTLKFKP
jgi:hypothetical protein